MVTGTIPIADISKIKQISIKKMSEASKLAIGTAVAVGIIMAAALAACELAELIRSSGAGRDGSVRVRGLPETESVQRARFSTSTTA